MNRSSFVETDIIMKIGGLQGEKLLRKILLSFGYNLYIHEYQSALGILASEMKVDLHKKRDKNAGEVKSMAMAFAKDFEYFISDDRQARVVAKRNLQKLDGSYFETIRMKDVITQIKNNFQSLEIDRKTAKKLFLYGTNPKLARNSSEETKLAEMRKKLKEDFDDNLWPVE